MIKSIVLDLDDTICFTSNRDWDNSRPNIHLIEKMRNLKEAGWEIRIFTARGSISCKTRKKAAKKYRKSIEKWLEKHDVPYDELSFEKPLAYYYVDDKGISPQDFIDLNIVELEGGLSGSELFTDGTKVHKRDPKAEDTRKWMEKADAVGLLVPKVEKIIGDVITMDHIEHDEFYADDFKYVAIGKLLETLINIKRIEQTEAVPYSAYIEKIKGHLFYNNLEMPELIENLEALDLEYESHHGDFGIKNILFKHGEPYLIDPIVGGFGCNELDCAKFCASILNESGDIMLYRFYLKMFAAFLEMHPEDLKILVTSELVRIIKYHPKEGHIAHALELV